MDRLKSTIKKNSIALTFIHNQKKLKVVSTIAGSLCQTKQVKMVRNKSQQNVSSKNSKMLQQRAQIKKINRSLTTPARKEASTSLKLNRILVGKRLDAGRPTFSHRKVADDESMMLRSSTVSILNEPLNPMQERLRKFKEQEKSMIEQTKDQVLEINDFLKKSFLKTKQEFFIDSSKVELKRTESSPPEKVVEPPKLGLTDISALPIKLQKIVSKGSLKDSVQTQDLSSTIRSSPLRTKKEEGTHSGSAMRKQRSVESKSESDDNRASGSVELGSMDLQKTHPERMFRQSMIQVENMDTKSPNPSGRLGQNRPETTAAGSAFAKSSVPNQDQVLNHDISSSSADNLLSSLRGSQKEGQKSIGQIKLQAFEFINNTIQTLNITDMNTFLNTGKRSQQEQLNMFSGLRKQSSLLFKKNLTSDLLRHIKKKQGPSRTNQVIPKLNFPSGNNSTSTRGGAQTDRAKPLPPFQTSRGLSALTRMGTIREAPMNQSEDLVKSANQSQIIQSSRDISPIGAPLNNSSVTIGQMPPFQKQSTFVPAIKVDSLFDNSYVEAEKIIERQQKKRKLDMRNQTNSSFLNSVQAKNKRASAKKEEDKSSDSKVSPLLKSLSKLFERRHSKLNHIDPFTSKIPPIVPPDHDPRHLAIDPTSPLFQIRGKTEVLPMKHKQLRSLVSEESISITKEDIKTSSELKASPEPIRVEVRRINEAPAEEAAGHEEEWSQFDQIFEVRSEDKSSSEVPPFEEEGTPVETQHLRNTSKSNAPPLDYGEQQRQKLRKGSESMVLPDSFTNDLSTLKDPVDLVNISEKISRSESITSSETSAAKIKGGQMLDQRIEIMRNLEIPTMNIKIPVTHRSPIKQALAPSQIHIKNTLGVNAMEKYTKSFIPLKKSATTARMSMMIRRPTLHSKPTIRQQKTISAESGQPDSAQSKKPKKEQVSRDEIERQRLLQQLDENSKRQVKYLESKLLNQTIIVASRSLAHQRNQRLFSMTQDFVSNLRNLSSFVYKFILSSQFVKERKKVKMKIAKAFEDLVSEFEGKKIHKLAFYTILQTEGFILMELEDYDLAIKCFKSLKNYCRKWQRENEMRMVLTRSQSPYVFGTRNFEKLLMTCYSQIGYLYRKMKMFRAASDYYKKQLILAWYYEDQVNEVKSYEDLAICYYYIQSDPNHMEAATQFLERAARGLLEQDRSHFKHMYKSLMKARDNTDLIYMKQATFSQNQNTFADEPRMTMIEGNRLQGSEFLASMNTQDLYPTIQYKRKGKEREDKEKLSHFRLSHQFKELLRSKCDEPISEEISEDESPQQAGPSGFLAHGNMVQPQEQEQRQKSRFKQIVVKEYEFEKLQHPHTFKQKQDAFRQRQAIKSYRLSQSFNARKTHRQQYKIESGQETKQYRPFDEKVFQQIVKTVRSCDRNREDFVNSQNLLMSHLSQMRVMEENEAKRQTSLNALVAQNMTVSSFQAEKIERLLLDMVKVVDIIIKNTA